MKLDRLTRRSLLRLLGLTTSLTIGSMGFVNYWFNYNVRKDVGESVLISEMDGLVAHTNVIVSDDYIAMKRYDPFGEGTRYLDKGRDGKIDWIQIYPPFFLLKIQKDLTENKILTLKVLKRITKSN